MCQFFQSKSRHKFVKVAGASATGSVFMKGYLGHPLDPNSGTKTTPESPAEAYPAHINPGKLPEINTVKFDPENPEAYLKNLLIKA